MCFVIVVVVVVFSGFLLFFVFVVVILCYVSFIDSEVKLFVRHTLCCCFFQLYELIAYKLRFVDEHIMIFLIFILSRINICLNQGDSGSARSSVRGRSETGTA